MTTPLDQDPADEALRALIAQADPERGVPSTTPTQLLERVRAGIADEAPAEPALSTAGPQWLEPTTSTAATVRPSFLHRHWQGMLVAAASVATLALAAGSVLPGLGAGSSDGALSAGSAVESSDSAAGGPALGAPDKAADGAGSLAGRDAATTPGTETTTPTQRLIRSASMLVGTEDITASRDSFVATVLTLGGRVTSESVVTEGQGGTPVYDSGVAVDRADMGTSYPYPWYASGPGVWLTVEVPADSYDRAVEAARAQGEVVQLQQSSYDVGTQIADVDARVKALESSLARLTALMDDAKDVSDVIALESAIAQRQSELDSLRAQQRDLANQTAMSTISLTLMSPEDARSAVDPQPDQTWWDSFLEGLGQAWGWLGKALLIVSPLLIAGGIIAWVRRRQRRSRAAAPAPDGPTHAAPAPADHTPAGHAPATPVAATVPAPEPDAQVDPNPETH